MTDNLPRVVYLVPLNVLLCCLGKAVLRDCVIVLVSTFIFPLTASFQTQTPDYISSAASLF